MILAALSALLAIFVLPQASSAATKRCTVKGKAYKTWVVFGSDRKVGDSKTSKVKRRGHTNVVTITAPGLPAASGKYHITAIPKKGCEVQKVRVKTRRGYWKKVKMSTAGGTLSFRADKGDPFPYREFRVWLKKAPASRPAKRTGDSCAKPFQASITGSERGGRLSEIDLYRDAITNPDGARIGWRLLHNNVICKYRIYLYDGRIVQPTFFDGRDGYYDYIFFGPGPRFDRIVVWAAKRP